MAGCCDPSGYDDIFGAGFARRMGKRYRRRGLDRTATRLVDFLVPDESVLQRSIRLLGPTTSATEAAISVRIAPVPDATRRRVGPGRSSEWPLAHPLFVALDLAQDAGRGREILDAWEPDERWTRVW